MSGAAEAYRAGWRAFGQGGLNPHLAGSECWRAWRCGWLDAWQEGGAVKHTPGPWEYEPENEAGMPEAIWSGGFPVAMVCGSPDIHHNARLIAAAPDLLAALTKYMEWCSADLVHGDPAKLRQLILDDARVVMAKLRGQA